MFKVDELDSGPDRIPNSHKSQRGYNISSKHVEPENFDPDDFFVKGWRETTVFNGLKKDKNTTSRAKGSKGNLESSSESSKNYAKGMDSTVDVPREVISKKKEEEKFLASIEWALDHMEKCTNANFDLIIESNDGYFDKKDIDPSVIIASPVKISEDFVPPFEDIFYSKCTDKYELKMNVNPEKFKDFIVCAITTGKNVSSYMPYFIHIRGLIASFDISLRQKCAEKDNIGGITSVIPKRKGFSLVSKSHLSNNCSLVACAHRALKEACNNNVKFKGIRDRFFSLFHEESNSFIVAKIPQ